VSLGRYISFYVSLKTAAVTSRSSRQQDDTTLSTQLFIFGRAHSGNYLSTARSETLTAASLKTRLFGMCRCAVQRLSSEGS